MMKKLRGQTRRLGHTLLFLLILLSAAGAAWWGGVSLLGARGLTLFVLAVAAIGGIAFSLLLWQRAKALAEALEARHRAEERLTVLAHAVEQAQDAVVITGREGLIEYVNSSFTAITGYGAEEAVGRTPGQLLKSGLQDKAFYALLWEAILSGETWTGRLTNRKKSGELYTVDESISAIRDAQGAITHFVAIQRDVTERRLLEAQLQQAQKMDAVGQVAGSVAHDFNNLLTPILGFAELLMNRLVDERSSRMAREIQRAARQASRLAQQLLTLGHRRIGEPQVLDLHQFLREREALLRRTLGDLIDLTIIRHPVPAPVLIDPAEFETAIFHLVINARDAMSRGGRLTITLESGDLTADQRAARPAAKPGPYVCLTVNDTGQGIAPNILPRIFEPFFTTKESGQRAGLGLAIMDGIIRRTGGFVEVASEIGCGTAFRLYLPQVTAQPRLLKEPACSPANHRGTETVLVVDDEPGVRALAGHVLKELGYHVIEAGDGETAIQLVEQQPGRIHVLLLNVTLPNASGIEVAERIRQKRPAIKVVFVSGRPVQASDIGATTEAGVTFLEKPFTPDGLARHVREVLEIRKA